MLAHQLGRQVGAPLERLGRRRALRLGRRVRAHTQSDRAKSIPRPVQFDFSMILMPSGSVGQEDPDGGGTHGRSVSARMLRCDPALESVSRTRRGDRCGQPAQTTGGIADIAWVPMGLRGIGDSARGIGTERELEQVRVLERAKVKLDGSAHWPRDERVK